jgi:hypothetical protein
MAMMMVVAVMMMMMMLTVVMMKRAEVGLGTTWCVCVCVWRAAAGASDDFAAVVRSFPHSLRHGRPRRHPCRRHTNINAGDTCRGVSKGSEGVPRWW